MKFRGVVELGGKTATGIEVPASVVDALAAGRRPAVTITLNRFAYRTTVATRDGRFLVPVSADVRAAAGVTAGDELDVEIELDTAARTVEVPADLATALADAGLQDSWDRLAYSHRREHAEAVTAAKKPDTRARRVEKVVQLLRAKR